MKSIEKKTEPTEPDECLVLACQAAGPGGDADAFTGLVRRHEHLVRGVCKRATGNEPDAEDASQETFLRAFRRIRSFRTPPHFARWLRRIAFNASIEQLRRRKAGQVALSGGAELDCAGLEAEPPDALGELERRDLVRDSVARLPAWMRDVLVRRYFDGLSYEEIGATLGLRAGTVKSRIHRGHAALARDLHRLCEGGGA